MNHRDHKDLLRDAIPAPGGVWADLGSGTGSFTFALAELLGEEGEIYSVDRDARGLRVQSLEMERRYPLNFIHYLQSDFTQPLELPPLDGIVMANSLHFHRNKEPLVKLLKGYLKPSGRFVLVEYNVDRGNTWVPYPISFSTWKDLAERCGFHITRFLTSRPSSFLKEIYSAISLIQIRL